MTADQQLAPDAQLAAAWQLYQDASAGLNDAYTAAIDAALADLGKASSEAYAAYDAAAVLAWDALQAGLAEARHLRDRAVNEAIEQAESLARAAIEAEAGTA